MHTIVLIVRIAMIVLIVRIAMIVLLDGTKGKSDAKGL